MEQILDFKPICRNIQNNDLYEYVGENDFINLRTKKAGSVCDEQAKKVLKINIEASTLINKYPIVKELISRLNLKYDK